MELRSGDGRPTTGPLLDWFYVSPGYVTFRSGTAEQWDSPRGIEIDVQQAEKSEPILVPDRPWEGGGVASVNGIFQRNDRYEMYYSTDGSCHCLAVSDDGETWTKPDLGVVEFDGSRRNNIVARGPGLTGYVFEDPSAPPEERFKLTTMRGGVYESELDADGSPIALGPTAFRDFELREELREDHTGKWGQMKGFLAGAVSPDGLRWTAIEKPLLAEFVDGDNITHYDSETGKYVAYLRFHTGGRRTVGRSETADFRRFNPEKVVLQPDPQDPPDTSFYGHAYTPYPGRDDLHLMFVSVYHHNADNIDLQLAVSHDGDYWFRPDRHRPIVPNGPAGTDDSGQIHAGPGFGLLPDGRWGLAYAGNGRLHNNDTDWYPPGPGERAPRTVRYAVWQQDRLAGIRARDQGHFTLRQERERPPENCPDAIEAPPRDTFPPLSNPNETPRQLKLNYRTEIGGWIKVELIPVVGTMTYPQIPAIDGYSFDDCDTLTGDHLDRVVTWGERSNVAGLSDTLAVRVKMYRTTLFSWSL